MRTFLLAALALAIMAIAGARHSTAAPPPAAHPFTDVARVLQSPRCLNCHPDGERPLQHDDSRPHAQNISRSFEQLGGKCSTCHQTFNLEGAHLPPGAPNWHLPPRSMAFQNRTPGQICRQLKDPATNGGKTLKQIIHHVDHDALVKWGWSPGAGRSLPPLSHRAFVAKLTAWVEQGAPCPE